MAGVATLSVTPSVDLRAVAPEPRTTESCPVLAPVGTMAVIAALVQPRGDREHRVARRAAVPVVVRITVPLVPKP